MNYSVSHWNEVQHSRFLGMRQWEESWMSLTGTRMAITGLRMWLLQERGNHWY